METNKGAGDPEFIPGLHFGWLTRFYDRFVRFALPEERMKQELIRRANLAPGQVVLDIGCGTGTLTVMAKRAHPETEISGYDIDAQMLTIAREKAEKENLSITFIQGSVMQMPFPGSSFDRIFASLMIHHLTAENKKMTFREIHRVLKPGGELLILDFGKPVGLYPLLISLISRYLEHTAEGIHGRLPEMLTDSGLGCEGAVQNFTTIFGTVSIFQALKG